MVRRGAHPARRPSRREVLAGLGAPATSGALLSLAAACGIGRQPEAPGATTRRPARLVFLAPNFPPAPPRHEIYERFLAEFQRDFPLATVEFVGSGSFAEHYVKLVTLFASGTPPDLTDTAADTQRHAEAGNIRVLDEMLRRWQRTDIYKAALESFSWKGKLYAMPWLGLTRAITYRRDFFTESGLDPTKPPQDWRELRDYAVQLTRRQGNDIVRAGIGITGNDKEFSGFLWQSGGDYFDTDGKRATFNSPEAVEALQFMSDLALKDRTYPPGGMPAQSIVAGTAAIDVIGGSTLLPAMKRAAPDQYQTLGAALPTKGKKRRACFAAFQSYTVTTGTKFPDEALDLLRVYTSDGFQVAINEVGGTLPVRKGLANAPYIQQEPRYKVYADAFEFGVNDPFHPKWVQVRDDVLVSALKRAWKGDVAPKTALDEAVVLANRILNT